ncbi:huntingtin-interacting protein K isoform X2 [Gopherus flavomarginatus]|uniref:huntingtin-interacting protein K isoform X2 n=1 Tax=Gopherus flavomarginatus TaxID=286002 RepID=UPI0021CBF722|nr:huntingtin-interacting protein K isoform X2 [Gopherus flavomarginatus]
MAAEGDVELELETEPNGAGGGADGAGGRPAEKPRKHDSGAADLERVTDYAEEKEIQSSNLETAMSVIGDRRSREQKAKQERSWTSWWPLQAQCSPHCQDRQEASVRTLAALLTRSCRR